MRFTMDGYQDGEACAERLLGAGFLPGHDQRGARRVVAAVLKDLLEGADQAFNGAYRDAELYAACQGIVECAEEDGLL